MPLKIALTSQYGLGSWFVGRLLSEGHKVDYYLEKPEYANILSGIVPTPRVKSKGDKYPNYGKYDLSLFDVTGREKQAEYSAQFCPTIGDGAFNCAAEDDRNFGLELMEEAGVQVPPYQRFTDVGEAKKFIKDSNKRYVYKPDTQKGKEQDADTTYVSSSAEDLLEFIDKLYKKTKGAPFILQEFIKGTEVSVEGWFNGEEFYYLNVTLEEKKFMNKGLGPNTGASGNLVFALNSGAELFKQGLGKMKDVLKQYQYMGMIDLNTIATEQGLFGLEWTPRFGYIASSTFAAIKGDGFGDMMYKIASGATPSESWKAEYGFGLTLSIPPYPTEVKGFHPQGVPIKGIDIDSPEYMNECYLFDVEKEGKDLVSAGHYGLLAAPNGIGNSIQEAIDNCMAKVKKIEVPNLQYRTDIDKCVFKRYNELDRMGLLR